MEAEAGYQSRPQRRASTEAPATAAIALPGRPGQAGQLTRDRGSGSGTDDEASGRPVKRDARRGPRLWSSSRLALAVAQPTKRPCPWRVGRRSIPSRRPRNRDSEPHRDAEQTAAMRRTIAPLRHGRCLGLERGFGLRRRAPDRLCRPMNDPCPLVRGAALVVGNGWPRTGQGVNIRALLNAVFMETRRGVKRLGNLDCCNAAETR